jgi:CrcB protein
LNQLLAIAAGGALGAVSRFGMSTGVYALLGRGFPYGTLAVNVLGSLLMGFLYVFLVERMTSSPEIRAVLLIGFLGSFTTFSTFSIETLTLMQQAEIFKAMLNVLLSVVVCLIATWAGFMLARAI